VCVCVCVCVADGTGFTANAAHTRTSLARESGWARVPMSQTGPCVECHETDCGRFYIYIYTCAQLDNLTHKTTTTSAHSWTT
jgi:hypothetical protein